MLIKPQPLSEGAFAPFGHFTNIYAHTNDAAAIHYAGDTIVFSLGEKTALGVCTIGPQKIVMAQMERHLHTEEGWIVLDNDCVAALGTPVADANAAQYQAFVIPKGTALSLKQGVWHLAPFPANDAYAHVLALLPPGTPAQDLELVELRETIEIAL